MFFFFFFFSSRRRHTRCSRDWSSDVCSSDLVAPDLGARARLAHERVVRRHRPIRAQAHHLDRKSTRLNSSHGYISYAVFCLKKKNELLPCSYVPSPKERVAAIVCVANSTAVM